MQIIIEERDGFDFVSTWRYGPYLFLRGTVNAAPITDHQSQVNALGKPLLGPRRIEWSHGQR